MRPSLHSGKVKGALVALIILLITACGGETINYHEVTVSGEGSCPGFRVAWATAQGPWGEVRPTQDSWSEGLSYLRVTVNPGYYLRICTSNTTQYALYDLFEGSYKLTYELHTTPSWHYSIQIMEDAQ